MTETDLLNLPALIKSLLKGASVEDILRAVCISFATTDDGEWQGQPRDPRLTEVSVWENQCEGSMNTQICLFVREEAAIRLTDLIGDTFTNWKLAPPLPDSGIESVYRVWDCDQGRTLLSCSIELGTNPSGPGPDSQVIEVDCSRSIDLR